MLCAVFLCHITVPTYACLISWFIQIFLSYRGIYRHFYVTLWCILIFLYTATTRTDTSVSSHNIQTFLCYIVLCTVISLSLQIKYRYFCHIMVCTDMSVSRQVFSKASPWNETLFLFQQLKDVEGCLLSDRWRPCTTHFLCGSLIHSWTLWHLPHCSEHQHHHLPRTLRHLSHQLHLCHTLCSTCNHLAAVSISLCLCGVISPFKLLPLTTTNCCS
jgi:hypothetical protein